MSPQAKGPELGIVLSMLYVAITDRHLDPQETEALAEEIRDLELEVDVQDLILEALRYPPTPVDLARRVTTPEDRRHALRAAVRAAYADGREVESEHRALVALARAFEVPVGELDELRARAAGASTPPKPSDAYLRALRAKLEDLGEE